MILSDRSSSIITYWKFSRLSAGSIPQEREDLFSQTFLLQLNRDNICTKKCCWSFSGQQCPRVICSPNYYLFMLYSIIMFQASVYFHLAKSHINCHSSFNIIPLSPERAHASARLAENCSEVKIRTEISVPPLPRTVL